MNDLRRMTTPALQDWWERYVCPACMSADRETHTRCPDPWHAEPAVTYACAASSLSPLSIPVAELQREGLLGKPLVRKYGRIWTLTSTPPPRAPAAYV